MHNSPIRLHCMVLKLQSQKMEALKNLKDIEPKDMTIKELKTAIKSEFPLASIGGDKKQLIDRLCTLRSRDVSNNLDAIVFDSETTHEEMEGVTLQ